MGRSREGAAVCAGGGERGGRGLGGVRRLRAHKAPPARGRAGLRGGTAGGTGRAVRDSAMREIVHIQAGQCGNQIGTKVSRGEPSRRSGRLRADREVQQPSEKGALKPTGFLTAPGLGGGRGAAGSRAAPRSCVAPGAVGQRRREGPGATGIRQLPRAGPRCVAVGELGRDTDLGGGVPNALLLFFSFPALVLGSDK